MTTIYIIEKSSGSWDNHISWIDRAYTDKDKAEKYKEKFNSQIKRIKDRLNELWTEKSLKEDWNDPFWDRYNNLMEINQCYIRETNLL